MSTNQPIDIQLGSSLIVRSDCEKMLEVKTDYKLNLTDMSVVKSDCEKMLEVKTDYKLNLMNMSKPYAMKLIITPYMIAKKNKILMNSFFNAQCNYCPRIWILDSCRNNNIVRNLHERCLRLIYNDKNSN